MFLNYGIVKLFIIVDWVKNLIFYYVIKFGILISVEDLYVLYKKCEFIGLISNEVEIIKKCYDVGGIISVERF